MIKRRTLLNGIITSSLILKSSLAFSQTASEKKVLLWDLIPDNDQGPKGAMRIRRNGGVSNISTPFLHSYIPNNSNGSAVLIAAGGGYRTIEVEQEAMPAVHWFNQRGIIACVLYYRLPRENWRSRPYAPLQDVQRAIRLMRSGHISQKIHPNKIIALGFSAGGHLMGMAAGQSKFNSYKPQDNVDHASSRPNLTVLAYPVITLKPPYDHTATRLSLIGHNPTMQQSAFWSVEDHVNKSYPATFLIQAENDPISNPINTLIMQQACKKKRDKS